MADGETMQVIARIRSVFPEKFGIPRQSGLVSELKAEILFEPEFRDPMTVRGLEGFSHIWLLWQFSENAKKGWSPTVRPPRLGGNRRVGVFASRSPYRPNPLGLSCVELEGVELRGGLGPVLHVAGADLMDGTPVYDIKPYLPYSDCKPEATGGFAPEQDSTLTVDIPPCWLAEVPEELRQALAEVLAQDPRPSYHHDPDREYGMRFGPLEVGFRVSGKVLTVYRCRKIT